jgi:hypothetical protein
MSSISAGTTVNTGLVYTSDTSGTLQIKTGASAVTAISIDASQNVGIGATPGEKLTVQTALTGTTAGSNTVARFQSNGNGYDAHLALGDNVNASARIGYLSGDLYLWANGAERVRADTSGNLKFNSGYGSVATAYGCRAWVNFNGNAGSTIRASGNVSSVTRNGVGDYTVNLTTAAPDANYCPVTQSVGESTTSLRGGSMVMGTWTGGATLKTTTQLRIYTGYTFTTGGAIDSAEVNVAIFR